MFRFYKFINYITIFSAFSMIFSVHAKDNETDLKIIGNILIPPPCKINQGGTVEVNFDQIGVNSVKGYDQKREVNYQIECGENTNNWQMYLSLDGTKSSFDINGLKTDIDDLAVKFQLDNNILNLGEKYPINAKSPGKLWAVLVKNGAVTLTAGNFVANGNLLVEYQ